MVAVGGTLRVLTHPPSPTTEPHLAFLTKHATKPYSAGVTVPTTDHRTEPPDLTSMASDNKDNDSIKDMAGR